MALYEVQVTEERTTTIYVEAASEREAEDAALELSSVQENDRWDEVDCWADVGRTSFGQLAVGTRIWSGGPKGTWITKEA